MEPVLAAIVALSPKTPEPAATVMASVIHEESNRQRVPPLLVVALAWHESQLKPRAVNEVTGAAGLLQIMPVHIPRATALKLKPNVKTGTKILARWMEKCREKKHPVERALSGFNGRKCVLSSWARQVIATWARLERQHGDVSGYPKWPRAFPTPA